jgi:hypothetical protein
MPMQFRGPLENCTRYFDKGGLVVDDDDDDGARSQRSGWKDSGSGKTLAFRCWSAGVMEKTV